MLKDNSDYLSNRQWLSDVLQGEDVVLRGTSALEYLQLFGGYMKEKDIDVYARKIGIHSNVHYKVVENYEGIDTVQIGGILCTTPNQTFNDMLEDYENIDEQSLIEALSRYYFKNKESFSGLRIKPENVPLFQSLTETAKEYYSGG